MRAAFAPPEDAFDQALYLLTRERADRAQPLLERVIESSRASGKEVLLTRALCVLGESLVQRGCAAEGTKHLNEALALSASVRGVDYERRCASTLLARIASDSPVPRGPERPPNEV